MVDQDDKVRHQLDKSRRY